MSFTIAVVLHYLFFSSSSSIGRGISTAADFRKLFIVTKERNAPVFFLSARKGATIIRRIIRARVQRSPNLGIRIGYIYVYIYILRRFIERLIRKVSTVRRFLRTTVNYN